MVPAFLTKHVGHVGLPGSASRCACPNESPKPVAAIRRERATADVSVLNPTP